MTAAAVSLGKRLGEFKHSILFVPIVVVDSPLMQCYLPEGSDTVALEEIKSGSLIHNTGDQRVMVRILHIDALPAFIEELKSSGSILQERLQDRRQKSGDGAEQESPPKAPLMTDDKS